MVSQCDKEREKYFLFFFLSRLEQWMLLNKILPQLFNSRRLLSNWYGCSKLVALCNLIRSVRRSRQSQPIYFLPRTSHWQLLLFSPPPLFLLVGLISMGITFLNNQLTWTNVRNWFASSSCVREMSSLCLIRYGEGLLVSGRCLILVIIAEFEL